MPNCPICGIKSQVEHIPCADGSTGYFGECPVCGFVNCDETFIDEIAAGNIEKHITSAIFRQLYIENRHKNKKIVKAKDLLELVTVPKTPMDKINRILIYLFNKQSSMADYIPIDPKIMYPITYSTDKDELVEFLHFLLEDQLVKEKSNQKIYSPSWGTGGVQYSDFCLTVKGWERADDIIRRVPDSGLCFIAMKFNDKMYEICDSAIKPALIECGYDSWVGKDNQKPGDITDEIIAKIRQSGLMVADYSHGNQGVYYEAGFARGLNIPVIQCFRKGSPKKNFHFDIEHNNTIIWRDADDLKKKLIDRIEANGWSRR